MPEFRRDPLEEAIRHAQQRQREFDDHESRGTEAVRQHDLEVTAMIDSFLNRMKQRDGPDLIEWVDVGEVVDVGRGRRRTREFRSAADSPIGGWKVVYGSWIDSEGDANAAMAFLTLSGDLMPLSLQNTWEPFPSHVKDNSPPIAAEDVSIERLAQSLARIYVGLGGLG